MIATTARPGFTPKFEVVSCFVENDGKILLLQRQSHKPQPNTFGVPAGKVDKGETPEEAVKREIQEEIGVRVDNVAYFTTMYVRHDDYEFAYHMYSTPFHPSYSITLNTEEHQQHLRATPEEALQLDLIEDEDTCIKTFYKIA